MIQTLNKKEVETIGRGPLSMQEEISHILVYILLCERTCMYRCDIRKVCTYYTKQNVKNTYFYSVDVVCT